MTAPDPPAPEVLIDPVALAERVRAHRHGLGLSLRAAAKEANVSPATLSRVERGDYLPARENLLKLARWAHIPIDPQVLGKAPRRREPHPSDAEPIEAVELHLRADKNLRDDQADTLVRMFRAAYEALRNDK